MPRRGRLVSETNVDVHERSRPSTNQKAFENRVRVGSIFDSPDQEWVLTLRDLLVLNSLEV